MIATSVKQSINLSKLGLSYKTSDMFYKHDTDLDGYIEKDIYELKIGHSYNEHDIPAWSLSSLIELMPSRVEEEYKLNMIKDDTTNGYYYNYSNRKERKMISSMAAYNLIDAAYNMVVWLLEKGYIKTEKK